MAVAAETGKGFQSIVQMDLIEHGGLPHACFANWKFNGIVQLEFSVKEAFLQLNFLEHDGDITCLVHKVHMGMTFKDFMAHGGDATSFGHKDKEFKGIVQQSSRQHGGDATCLVHKGKDLKGIVQMDLLAHGGAAAISVLDSKESKGIVQLNFMKLDGDGKPGLCSLRGARSMILRPAAWCGLFMLPRIQLAASASSVCLWLDLYDLAPQIAVTVGSRCVQLFKFVRGYGSD
mmetsp:Transcript_13536/g.26668  ORF Transcript_13536/g.26668 Transcript_13536/m.26668 type:complete len:232 (-) Transcript_13536:39-734(-)